MKLTKEGFDLADGIRDRGELLGGLSASANLFLRANVYISSEATLGGAVVGIITRVHIVVVSDEIEFHRRALSQRAIERTTFKHDMLAD